MARERKRGSLLIWAKDALDLVLPLSCPGCGRGGAWCAECAGTLAGVPRAVVLPDRLLDALAEDELPVPAVYALSRYSGQARAAIIAGKERGRRDLPVLLGDAIGRGVRHLQDTAVIGGAVWMIPAPTRRSAARARGGDPVLVMARSAARRLAGDGRSTGVAPCLELAPGARDSVGLDAAARAANLAGRVRFRAVASPPARSEVVLLDDVLTTGATVSAAMRTLHGAGVTVGTVLVVAAVPPLRPVFRAVVGV
jgi:predicted amidophosphoribosyltransferase